MTIKEKMHGDVAVISLKGKLMGGPETQEIHDKVKKTARDFSNTYYCHENIFQQNFAICFIALPHQLILD